MIRILLVTLALAVVPFLIYLFYDIARRGPDGRGARSPKDWEKDSVLNLGFAGLFLAVLGLVGVLAFGGESGGGVYEPARIENGKLIDGRFNTDKSDPERNADSE